MKEHTKEVINLCKQIAEKHRKQINKGDCVAIRSYGDLSGKTEYKVKLVDDKFLQESLDICFPLWTISDCLGFLKERYDDVNLGSIQGEWEVQVYDAYDRVHHPEFLEDIRGKTPLEACLKVVLAVLEEKK